MPITPSQRPTREWPCSGSGGWQCSSARFCIPLWQWTAGNDGANDFWQKWTPDRLRKLLLGPEQIACYLCFVWGIFILVSRYLEVLRQRRALGFGLLPSEEGSRILPEDARPLQRKLEALTGRRPYILANMIRMALSRYAISHSSADASEVVRTQADVDLGRLVTSMSTVHYLAWAIPAIGFIGTVRGLASAMPLAARMMNAPPGEDNLLFSQATAHLDVAFDCTLVALVLSLGIMFLLHSVQRDEESLVIDCQQYCQEHLVTRLYVLEPEHEMQMD